MLFFKAVYIISCKICRKLPMCSFDKKQLQNISEIFYAVYISDKIHLKTAAKYIKNFRYMRRTKSTLNQTKNSRKICRTKPTLIKTKKQQNTSEISSIYHVSYIKPRDDVVVSAFASQSVNLGLVSQVESYQKTKRWYSQLLCLALSTKAVM